MSLDDSKLLPNFISYHVWGPESAWGLIGSRGPWMLLDDLNAGLISILYHRWGPECALGLICSVSLYDRIRLYRALLDDLELVSVLHSLDPWTLIAQRHSRSDADDLEL